MGQTGDPLKVAAVSLVLAPSRFIPHYESQQETLPRHENDLPFSIVVRRVCQVMFNDTLSTIARRHSVRLFAPTPVPDDLLSACLEAANHAPSAHNQQSWRFLIIKGERKRALAELVAARSGGFPKPAAVLLRLAARAIAGAPVVVGVANTGELIAHGSELFALNDRAQAHDFFRTMEIQSSAAAVENLLLAATALGLGSVWLGVLYLLKDEILVALGEPAGEFMAVVPLGYAEREGRRPGKKPLAERVRYLE